MKILIIGLGSIGKRHVKVLRSIYEDVTFFAFRRHSSASNYEGVTNIFDLSEVDDTIDFVIIANPTSEHFDTLRKVIHFNKPIFIEKPLSHSLDQSLELLNEIKKRNLITYVGCNLRFHPAIQFLKEHLTDKRILETTLYCGSFLPDWRADTDYRETYSAQKKLGGGVHLDLIHEIDYCVYLLGFPQNTHRYCATKSSLEIDSCDIAHYTLEYEHYSTFITMNYYRTDPKRTLEIVFEDDTWNVDLIQNKITNSKNEIVFQTPFERLQTSLDQMKYFISCIQSNSSTMNDFEMGLKTLEICIK